MVKECSRQRHVCTWQSFIHAKCKWESLDLCSNFYGREQDTVLGLNSQWWPWIYNWSNDISKGWLAREKVRRVTRLRQMEDYRCCGQCASEAKWIWLWCICMYVRIIYFLWPCLSFRQDDITNQECKERISF